MPEGLRSRATVRGVWTAGNTRRARRTRYSARRLAALVIGAARRLQRRPTARWGPAVVATVLWDRGGQRIRPAGGPGVCGSDRRCLHPAVPVRRCYRRRLLRRCRILRSMRRPVLLPPLERLQHWLRNLPSRPRQEPRSTLVARRSLEPRIRLPTGPRRRSVGYQRPRRRQAHCAELLEAAEQPVCVCSPWHPSTSAVAGRTPTSSPAHWHQPLKVRIGTPAERARLSAPKAVCSRALRSHRRGRWFDTSIAHPQFVQVRSPLPK